MREVNGDRFSKIYSDRKISYMRKKGIEPVGFGIYINEEYEFTYKMIPIRIYSTRIIHKVFKNFPDFAKDTYSRTALRFLCTTDMIEHEKYETKAKTRFHFFVLDSPDTAYQIMMWMKVYGYISGSEKRIELDMNIIYGEIMDILEPYRNREAIESLLHRSKNENIIAKRINMRFIIPVYEWVMSGLVRFKRGNVWFSEIHIDYAQRFSIREMTKIIDEYSDCKGIVKGRTKTYSIKCWYYPYMWRVSNVFFGPNGYNEPIDFIFKDIDALIENKKYINTDIFKGRFK